MFDGSGNAYVGQADGEGTVLKFDPAGNLLETYSPEREDRGTDWIALASDECTLYYTSEGQSIKRYNVCTSTQLPDFATSLGSNCFALRIRGNNEVMVACTPELLRLSSTGAILQHYPAANYPGLASLFAANLDPDGTSVDLFAALS